MKAKRGLHTCWRKYEWLVETDHLVSLATAGNSLDWLAATHSLALTKWHQSEFHKQEPMGDVSWHKNSNVGGKRVATFIKNVIKMTFFSYNWAETYSGVTWEAQVMKTIMEKMFWFLLWGFLVNNIPSTDKTQDTDLHFTGHGLLQCIFQN